MRGSALGSHCPRRGPPSPGDALSSGPGPGGARQSGRGQHLVCHRALWGRARDQAMTLCCSHRLRFSPILSRVEKLTQTPKPVVRTSTAVLPQCSAERAGCSHSGLGREGKGRPAPGQLSPARPGDQAGAHHPGRWKAARRTCVLDKLAKPDPGAQAPQFLWVSCPQQHDPGMLP